MQLKKLSILTIISLCILLVVPVVYFVMYVESKRPPVQMSTYEVTYRDGTADTVFCYGYFEKYEIVHFYTESGYANESTVLSVSLFNLKSINKLKNEGINK